MTAQREAFEAWAETKHLPLTVESTARCYRQSQTAAAWGAWQAAQAAVLIVEPVAWADRAELRDMTFAVVVRKFQNAINDFPLYTKETP